MGLLPHDMAAGFPRTSNTWERGSTRQKAKSFYNLIPDLSPDHFCHILFFSNNSMSLAQHSGGGDRTRVWLCRGGRSEGPLRGCLLHRTIFFFIYTLIRMIWYLKNLFQWIFFSDQCRVLGFYPKWSKERLGLLLFTREWDSTRKPVQEIWKGWEAGMQARGKGWATVQAGRPLMLRWPPLKF